MGYIQTREEYDPTPEDRLLAQGAWESLSKLIGQAPLTHEPLELDFRLAEIAKARTVKIPAGILELILTLLDQAARGNSVTIIPATKEFTTQEAADFLNVSRPYVIKLLEQGVIPFHKIGAHRRINAHDLMMYKQNSDDERKKAFGELAKLSQDMKLGYE